MFKYTEEVLTGFPNLNLSHTAACWWSKLYQRDLAPVLSYWGSMKLMILFILSQGKRSAERHYSDFINSAASTGESKVLRKSRRLGNKDKSFSFSLFLKLI